jgi:hypothetical protein
MEANSRGKELGTSSVKWGKLPSVLSTLDSSNVYEVIHITSGEVLTVKINN